MKYKVIVWGTGQYFYTRVSSVLKYEYRIGSIDLICFTGRELPARMYTLEEVPLLCVEEALQCPYDFILIASEAEIEIQKTLINAYHINRDKIIRGSVFALPGFSLAQYIKIKMSKVSIFAESGYGSAIYRNLRLQFRSPFVNMYIPPKDYLKFLRCPEAFLQQPFTYSHLADCSESITGMGGYPVYLLGDEIAFHCFHVRTPDSAQRAWKRRLHRINYDKMLFLMILENDADAEEFAALEGINKLGFYYKDAGCRDIFPVPEYTSRKYESHYHFRSYVEELLCTIDILQLLCGRV